MGLFSDYQITDEGVKIRIYFFSKTILFNDIKSIQKVTFLKAFLMLLNPLRPPAVTTGEIRFYVVLIETMKGRLIEIAPKKPDEFVRLVSKHLPISH
jgi:hypothetical protein